MIVQCSTCAMYFDDAYRLTYCPHDTFAANDGSNNFAHYYDSYYFHIAPELWQERGVKTTPLGKPQFESERVLRKLVDNGSDTR